jgi:hypothetical protein
MAIKIMNCWAEQHPPAPPPPGPATRVTPGGEASQQRDSRLGAEAGEKHARELIRKFWVDLARASVTESLFEYAPTAGTSNDFLFAFIDAANAVIRDDSAYA